MKQLEIVVTIQTGNAAFENCPGAECGRILKDLAVNLSHHSGIDLFTKGGRWTLRDLNGNKVGYVTVSTIGEDSEP